MKYTTTQFRVDGAAKHIEIYQDIKFVDLYRKLIHLWSRYTNFSKVPFPGPITDMFPVSKDTTLAQGRGIKW